MKKNLFAFVSVVVALFLVACSTSQNMDGEYYLFDKEDSYLYDSKKIVIEGNTVTINGNEKVTIDKEKKEFSKNSLTKKYIYKDGEMSVDGEVYVRLGTKAYDEARKANEDRLARIEEENLKKLQKAKQELQGRYYLIYSHTDEASISFEIGEGYIVVENDIGENPGKYDLVFNSFDEFEFDGHRYSFSYGNGFLSLQAISIEEGQKYYKDAGNFKKD